MRWGRVRNEGCRKGLREGGWGRGLEERERETDKEK